MVCCGVNESMPMIRYGTWCGDKIARNDGRCCTATEDQCSLEKELQCTRGMVDCMRNSAWVPPGNRVLSFPAGQCMINGRRTSGIAETNDSQIAIPSTDTIGESYQAHE